MQPVREIVIEECLRIYHSREFRESRSEKGSSIGYGSLGKCFFLLELYRQTARTEIMNDIAGCLRTVGESYAAGKTNNQGLFYGRSGLPYLYLELYRATQERKFLEKCLCLTQQRLNSPAGLFHIQDNASFIKGIAGVVLLYLQLYNETKEDWINDRIWQNAGALIDRAHLTESGIYWNGIDCRSCNAGFAAGGSGVSLALLELGRVFDPGIFHTLAERALTEEDEFLTKERATSLNLSLSRGLAGQSLVRMYCHLQNGDRRYDESIDKLRDNTNYLLDNPEKVTDHSLFNGLAGIGIAFKEAYSLTKKPRYGNVAGDIALQLVQKLRAVEDMATADWSFFSGLTGIGYSLLKITDPGEEPSILFPRISKPVNGESRLSWQEVNRRILRKNFGKTAGVIQKQFPGEWTSFLSSGTYISPSDLGQWINGLRRDHLPEDVNERLGDVVERDFTIIKIKGDYSKFMLEDNVDFARSIEKILQMSEDEFRNLRLVVSDKAVLLNKEPSIDYSNPIAPNLLVDIFEAVYGRRSYYFWADAYNDFHGEEMLVLRVFSDLFVEPCPVHEVLKITIDFVMSQNDQIIGILMDRVGAGDREFLRAELARLFSGNIRTMLSNGIVVVDKQHAAAHSH